MSNDYASLLTESVKLIMMIQSATRCAGWRVGSIPILYDHRVESLSAYVICSLDESIERLLVGSTNEKYQKSSPITDALG
jgi:NaMN:DMB phosphoribosyltransferase